MQQNYMQRNLDKGNSSHNIKRILNRFYKWLLGEPYVEYIYIKEFFERPQWKDYEFVYNFSQEEEEQFLTDPKTLEEPFHLERRIFEALLFNKYYHLMSDEQREKYFSDLPYYKYAKM